MLCSFWSNADKFMCVGGFRYWFDSCPEQNVFVLLLLTCTSPEIRMQSHGINLRVHSKRILRLYAMSR